ncbi:hypothetical protein JDV02_008349 [Purpureocillium takamizusanense]|uniref:HMA domain-containing protein n=1 Tax=Purpureocillium takamizusanense TaxID=2060973 RepID=A0A9Q8VD78_9HYPO|nr:uncharacterized protein JDV02_008349 [Purpureocillium takamizusanense]UNI22460.1 hypothetical protein JDV02_008349 [Purpureocillium takamizusanense]
MACSCCGTAERPSSPSPSPSLPQSQDDTSTPGAVVDEAAPASNSRDAQGHGDSRDSRCGPSDVPMAVQDAVHSYQHGCCEDRPAQLAPEPASEPPCAAGCCGGTEAVVLPPTARARASTAASGGCHGNASVDVSAIAPAHQAYSSKCCDGDMTTSAPTAHAADCCCADKPMNVANNGQTCSDGDCCVANTAVESANTDCCDDDPLDNRADNEQPCARVCCGVNTVVSGKITDTADTCCDGDKTAKGGAATDGAKQTCGDGCCDESSAGKQKTNPSTSLADASTDDQQACTEGCCNSQPDDTRSRDVTDCCRDKPSPCCDESCLDRLALRECDSKACDASSCDTSSSSVPKNRACGRHRRSTRERYGATLEALGCICRALIALGQESCCDTKKRSSLSRNKCTKRQSGLTSSRSSLDLCCASGASIKTPRATIRARRQKAPCCGEEACKSSSMKPSCETRKPTAGVGCAASCCSPTRLTPSESKAMPKDDCGGDTCCSSGEKPSVGKIQAAVVDPENQVAGVEHVVLCVSGMTCTGCETKLNRTLATVAGVRSLKTSLVLSRAEFDVDLTLTSVESVIKHLERTTEFTCERVSNQGATLDLIVDGNADSLVDQTWPSGVIDVTATSKGTVRVVFDPKLLGARDLMDRDWGAPVKLAPIRGDPGLEAGSKHVRHVGYMTLLSAVLTVPVLVLAWAPLPDRELAYSSASLALATIVQVVIAGPFYPKALKALVFSRVIEMDLLIVLSTSAAYIFSVVSFGYLVAARPLSTGQFFATSTLLVTLIMVGRYMAALARQKAVESISIRSLQTATALLVDDLGGGERQIDARLLQYGDIFKVLADSRIPTDGTVISGSSEVDESMLTGESMPVEKHAKSSVIAGTINGSGTLVIRLARLPGDNTITTIATMVDEAKLSKPKLQELADLVASYFVPVVVGLTILTFVIWVAVGKTVRGKSGSEATVDAITYAITVLIVSCPCAIGLAVPMVIVIASGVAAERGVIFKSASAIEVAHRTSHVVFDKTGTLTEGKMKVVSENLLTQESACQSLLLGLISGSRHPVSVAVADYLKSKNIESAIVPDAKSLTGKGVEAHAAGRILRAGNARWLDLSCVSPVQSALASNLTVFCFTIDGTLAAVYGLENSLRNDAKAVVSDLQARGISVHIVSGDDDGAVQAVASKLDVPSSNAHARKSPADKQAYINKLFMSPSKGREPVVIFCGDGTNDAVALAQATIGVHMNEGSDMAKSAADVVLMRPDLSGIAVILDISRRSVNRIGFNFAWSFVYNTVAVLLASGALVKARIPPQFAGLGELVSVLPVILAAVLLRWPRR